MDIRRAGGRAVGEDPSRACDDSAISGLSRGRRVSIRARILATRAAGCKATGSAAGCRVRQHGADVGQVGEFGHYLEVGQGETVGGV